MAAMPRPRRDDYPPGDAGNAAFDKADFTWQMANNKGANQGPVAAQTAEWRDGVRRDAVDGSAVKPIGDVSGTGKIAGKIVAAKGPTIDDIPVVGGGMAAQASRNKAFKIALEKYQSDPVFRAEWDKNHGGVADPDPTGEMAKKANLRSMR